MDTLIDPAFERWLQDNRPTIFELIDEAGANYRKATKQENDVGTFPWRKPQMKSVINPINKDDEPSKI